MSAFCNSDVTFPSLAAATAAIQDSCQKARIRTALGIVGRRPVPRLDEETHGRYFAYLSANLVLPFAAHHLQPLNPREEREFRCTVLELMDPRLQKGEESDGILCKVSKEDRELLLPLIDMSVPPRSRNSQLIEDYWYWLWNWR